MIDDLHRAEKLAHRLLGDKTAIGLEVIGRALRCHLQRTATISLPALTSRQDPICPHVARLLPPLVQVEGGPSIRISPPTRPPIPTIEPIGRLEMIIIAAAGVVGRTSVMHNMLTVTLTLLAIAIRMRHSEEIREVIHIAIATETTGGMSSGGRGVGVPITITTEIGIGRGIEVGGRGTMRTRRGGSVSAKGSGRCMGMTGRGEDPEMQSGAGLDWNGTAF